MKYLLFAIFLMITLSPGLAKSEGNPVFFSGTWEQAVAKAKAEHKLIFVDFYASWCGPCKWMSSIVFMNDSIVNALDSEFVAMQIDAEKEAKELVQQTNIQAYPTLALFGEDGRIMMKHEGALDVKGLIAFLQSPTTLSTREIEFRMDPLNFEKFQAFKKLLAMKDVDKVKDEVTRFMASLSAEQLKTMDAWRVFVDDFSDYESPVVETMFENANLFVAEPDFNDGLGWYMESLLTRATDSAGESYLQKAKKLYTTARKVTSRSHRPEDYYEKALELTVLMEKDDTVTFRKQIVNFLKTYHSNDPDVLSRNVEFLICKSGQDKVYQLQLLKLAERAYQLKNDVYNSWVLALSLSIAQPEESRWRKQLLRTFSNISRPDLFLSPRNLALQIEPKGILVTEMYRDFN